jgi:ribosome-associated protein
LEKLSKTKKKKAAENLQKMGEDLVALDEAQLEALDLPPDLKAAIGETRSFKSHGARRRQLQFIGRLMRNYDTGIIQQALQKMAAADEEKRRRFKIVERWRDELASGDEGRLNWLLANYRNIDAHQLNHLVNCARGVTTQMNAKEAARKLFRFLSRLEGEIPLK